MNKDGKNITYPLNQIYFYLTEGCNLRCRHCWISPGHQDDGLGYPFLDPEIFLSVIRQARPMGLRGVKLTGGEPLLHPDIIEMLNTIHDEDISLTVETNGVLCSPDLAVRIAGCRTPFVSVSIDGATPEIHEWVRGVPGCFDMAVDGIKNLVNAGLRPQIIMTVMRRNIHQMEDIIHMAESLGAGSVKFNIVQPTARGEQMHRAGETLSINDLIKLGKWVENELTSTTNLSVYYSHPPAFRPLGRIFGEKGDGCSVCGILGIIGVLACGSYALCGIGQSVPDLVFGDAASDPLEAIWFNSPVLNEIREGLPRHFKGICGKCVMLGSCLGNCLAQNYYTCGNFWTPYWYCDKAWKAGLFPETRIRPEQR